MTRLSEYRAKCAEKQVRAMAAGFEPANLSCRMKPHQRAVTEFALQQGRAALFLDTGLGKTLCALEWGREVVQRTNMPVLMLSPLAVSKQHEREACKFDIDAVAIKDPSEMTGARVYITNYERINRFSPDEFAGVVLDESSIIKSFAGSTAKALISSFANTQYRLACTATPAPNDHMELGQHSEFLGALSQTQMLTRWFIHDSADTGTWRMKGHAVADFWSWVASWARCVSKPSDIGFSDDGYTLPPLDVKRHIVASDRGVDTGHEADGQARLFRMPDTSATSIHREKRLTVAARADMIADIVGQHPNEPWVIWCDTDYEADELANRIPHAIEVRGSMSPDVKEANLSAFSTGEARVIITKPSIAGFGLNWQHCARMAFVGLSFSYESFYQAVRRCWRFGQTRSVQVHVACADTEESIWQIVSRKQGDHDAMKAEMVKAMNAASRSVSEVAPYNPTNIVQFPEWLK